MRLSKYSVSFGLALLFSSGVYAASTPIETLKQTCQCPNCDLKNVDLSNWQPASAQQFSANQPKDKAASQPTTCNPQGR